VQLFDPMQVPLLVDFFVHVGVEVQRRPDDPDEGDGGFDERDPAGLHPARTGGSERPFRSRPGEAPEIYASMQRVTAGKHAATPTDIRGAASGRSRAPHLPERGRKEPCSAGLLLGSVVGTIV
jgi:hypothetical protein